MKIFQTRTSKIAGTTFKEIYKKAFYLYKDIKKKTKRKPYIRSIYFNKEKVFLDLFWSHLFEKNYWDQTRRLKFFICAIDLIKNSRFEPASKENPNKPSEILHRFAGMSAENDLFFVQIKEEKRSGKKWFISVFPAAR
jgi:hypothetical protein